MNQHLLAFLHCFLLLNLVSLPTVSNGEEFDDVKLLREIPFSDTELKSAYSNAASDSCEQIGEGQPFDISSFTPYLTPADRQDGTRRSAATRKGFLSIGLEVEQAGLPLLSKSQILDYVDKHYVTIQARVRKDLLDRKLYYHHRPLALTCRYTGPKLSNAFEPVVSQTTSNIRSLGVFADRDKRPLKAEYLRTLVLAFRFERMGLRGKTNEDFELAIIRGRESIDGLSLQHHVFITQDHRSRFIYLRPFEYPRLANGCSIIGKVKITEFDSTTGLYPKRTITQDYRVASRLEFDITTLDKYCQEKFDASIATQINQLLDDIIDKKLDIAR